MRAVRRAADREPAGEVPVRPRGVLPEPVPQPAHALRQAPVAATLPPHRQLTSHRAAVLRTPRREDPDRNTHQGYAAVRELLLLAVHGDHVTHDVAPPSVGLIHALRPPALRAGRAARAGAGTGGGCGHVVQRGARVPPGPVRPCLRLLPAPARRAGRAQEDSDGGQSAQPE